MPRGGARAGAGRIAGSGKRAHGQPARAVSQVKAEAAPDAKPLTPLEFMLTAMNDPGEDRRVRAQMAIAAAPYCHPKIAEGGKKESKAEAARKAMEKYPSLFDPPRLVANNAG